MVLELLKRSKEPMKNSIVTDPEQIDRVLEFFVLFLSPIYKQIGRKTAQVLSFP
jgi:hypothetical protein